MFRNKDNFVEPDLKLLVDAKYGAWYGGSILSSLSWFQKEEWIKKKEWEEEGAFRVVCKKYPMIRQHEYVHD